MLRAGLISAYGSWQTSAEIKQAAASACRPSAENAASSISAYGSWQASAEKEQAAVSAYRPSAENAATSITSQPIS